MLNQIKQTVMTAQEFSEYRGKNVMIEGATLPIAGYGCSDLLIVGVSKEIKEKETEYGKISIAWKTLYYDDVIEKEYDYYLYALTNTVIL